MRLCAESGVFRTLTADGTYGPAEAWKGAGTAETVTVPVTVYNRDSSTGTCTAQAGFTGVLAALVSVTAPPDFTGPLTYG